MFGSLPDQEFRSVSQTFWRSLPKIIKQVKYYRKISDQYKSGSHVRFSHLVSVSHIGMENIKAETIQHGILCSHSRKIISFHSVQVTHITYQYG